MHTTNVFTPVANTDRVFVFEDCCNVYLIKQDDHCILIDLGSGAVLEHLDKIGIKTVDAVYFTHAHRDQLQGISRMLEAEVPVRFPVGARDYIERERRPDLNNIRQFLRAYPGNRFDMPRPFSGGLFDIQPNSRLPCGDIDLEVVPIPGHLNHQIAYLVDLCGERIAFCGDAMYSAGKIHEPFNLETDHYTGTGARLAAESLRMLKQLRPSVICPSHGPVTSDNTWSAFEKTINRLHELAELKDTICPGIPHVKRLVAQRGSTLVFVSEHLLIWNNSYFLLSDDGPVLMVDNAGPLPESFWEQYERLIGDRRIEVVLVSHIHCDHVEGIEALRAKQPHEVWVHESIADAIEEPHRFRRPYLPVEGTRVDRRLKTGETYKWREYDFSSYWFPAQTDLHAAYHFTIDGHRALFSGDNFYPPQQWGGTGGLSGFNGGHPLRGWKRSIELVLELEPEWILASHTQPFPYRRTDFLAMLAWSQNVARIMCDIAPDGNLERHHSPHFISLTPYLQSANSASINITARVMNTYEHSVEVELDLLLPENTETHARGAKIMVKPDEIGEWNWEVNIADEMTGTQMVIVNVIYDGQYWGQKAECYVHFSLKG